MSVRREHGTDHLSRTGQIELGHLSRSDRPSRQQGARFAPLTGQTGQMICSHARARDKWSRPGNRAHALARARDQKTSVPSVPLGVENGTGDHAVAGFNGTDGGFGSVPCLSRDAKGAVS